MQGGVGVGKFHVNTTAGREFDGARRRDRQVPVKEKHREPTELNISSDILKGDPKNLSAGWAATVLDLCII